MNPRKYLPVLFLCVLFSLYGCEENTKDDKDPVSSFDVSISGDVNRSLSGDAAIMSLNSSPPDEGFGISMASSDENSTTLYQLNFFLNSASIPKTGTYSISDTATETIFHAWYNASGSIIEAFFAESGSITVTFSSNKRIAGTFEFKAKGFLAGDYVTEYEVTVSGSFDALRPFY